MTEILSAVSLSVFSWSMLGRRSSATFLLPRPEKGVWWPTPCRTHPVRVAAVALKLTDLASISRNGATGRATWRHLSSSPEALSHVDGASVSNGNAFCTDAGLWLITIDTCLIIGWSAPVTNVSKRASDECQRRTSRLQQNSPKERMHHVTARRPFSKQIHSLTQQEIHRRSLCYSPKNSAVFCFTPKLMSQDTVFANSFVMTGKHA